jgi:hypothetical protein
MLPEGDLLLRIKYYEDLLKQRGIQVDAGGGTALPAGYEALPSMSTSPALAIRVASEPELALDGDQKGKMIAGKEGSRYFES